MGIVEEAAAYARETYSSGDWPHIIEVVTYGQWLAKRTGADEQIVTLAAYLHDVSRPTMGPREHNVKSAALAREWLNRQGYPSERIERVAEAVVAHMRPAVGPERQSLALEGRILYDADKISRAQGIGLLAALVRLGKRIPWEELSYQQLADAIQQGCEVTRETYRTLYTDEARELAGPGHKRAIEFCNSLLQMEVSKGAGER
jgi:HD superfamily phosphodiesterase